MKTSLLLSASALVLVLAAAACVGDDPVGGASDVPDSGGLPGADAGGGDSSPPPTCAGDTVEACGASCTPCTAPTDGTVACTAGACAKTCSGALPTLCGDACVDTMTSATSCGACGHACVVGPCIAGACQPFPVATGFTDVHAIDISPSGLVISADEDLTICNAPEGCTPTTLKTIGSGLHGLLNAAVGGGSVYFSVTAGDFGLVKSCPLSGCPAVGAVEIENLVNSQVRTITAGPSTVVWSRSQGAGGSIQSCALPGCSSLQPIRAVPTDPNDPGRETTVPVVTMGVGATTLLYATGIDNEGATYLRSCPLGALCTAPTKVDTAGGVVSALTQHAGLLYGASHSGANDVIWSVTDAAPGAARTPLVSDATGVTDIAVDASGIYWVNGMTGKVQRCATLTGCAGGGTLLASGQTGAARVRLDANFVYWMTPTAVFKIAK